MLMRWSLIYKIKIKVLQSSINIVYNTFTRRYPKRNQTSFFLNYLFNFLTKNLQSPSKYPPLALIHFSNFIPQFKTFFKFVFYDIRQRLRWFFLYRQNGFHACLFSFGEIKKRMGQVRVIYRMGHKGRNYWLKIGAQTGQDRAV